MTHVLPYDRMPEAEVSLLLAFYLLAMPGSQGLAEVAIDGAQIQVSGKEVFPIEEFLLEKGWTQVEQVGKNAWQGWYKKDGQRLRIHSKPGVGDVDVKVGDRRVRAECKGGPLFTKRGSREYPILRGALGQMITVDQVDETDTLVVAVPHTPKFCTLAEKCQRAPLMARAGIHIVLVGRDGSVQAQGEEGWRMEFTV